jgi:DNA-binding IscR family transcriptional regulator
VKQRPITFRPNLCDALGGTEDAVVRALIIEMLWSARDDNGEALVSYPEMARRLRLSQHRIERHTTALREAGILTSRLSEGPGSRNAWTVHWDPDRPTMEEVIAELEAEGLIEQVGP